jgi:energy-coupling factor transport system ATP-binding protein
MSISFEKLSHVYMPDSPFETKAIDNVTLTIDQGEFVGFIGHTGSGKTTLVQHINALLKPTTGKVIVNGLDINEDKAKLRELRKKVGFVFQYPEYQLFEETVEKDIAFGPSNLDLSKEDITLRVEESMQLVGLDANTKDRSPFELSGGQRRRVALAGVLAMRPEVLILDEPTAGLDPGGRLEMLEMLKTMHQNENITIIMISHYMDEIASVCTKVLVMEDGKPFMYDEPKRVFSHGEKLREMGLDVPVVTKLIMTLKNKGVDVPMDILTLEEFHRYIKDKVRGDSDV